MKNNSTYNTMAEYLGIFFGTLGLLVIMLVFVLGFWAVLVGIFCWAFDFEFSWKYVIGAWITSVILRLLFGRNK